MKVLYVRNLYWPTDFGGNRYPYEVTRRLAARGHDVTVVTGREIGRHSATANERVRVSYFPVVRAHPVITHLSNTIACIPAVNAALARHPDAALVGSYDVGLAYFTRRHRPPSAFIYHSAFYSEAVERLARRGPPGRLAHSAARVYMRAVERRVLARAERLIAVSDFSREEIAARSPEAAARTVLIPTGVDTSFFVPPADRRAARERLGVSQGTRVAVVVGRLVGVKRYDRAIDAVGRLGVLGYPTILLVVGDGPERQRLVEHARRRGLADSVRFLGFLSGEAHREALWAADIQLCSSEFENLSLALLEGLSTGLPVVALPTGGTVGLLSSIDDRLLAESVDADALAARAASLLGDAPTAVSLGQRARAWVVRRHDWETVVDAIELVLRELADVPRHAT